jgi:hypothetical protein
MKLAEAELGYVHWGPGIDETVFPAGWNMHFCGPTIFFGRALIQASAHRSLGELQAIRQWILPIAGRGDGLTRLKRE